MDVGDDSPVLERNEIEIVDVIGSAVIAFHIEHLVAMRTTLIT